MTDFDWRKAGTPEQLAAYLEAIAERMNVPHAVIPAQCIRGLAEENDNLKAENDRLREAIKRELQCVLMVDYGHMIPCHGWDDRLVEALSAHDQGGG